MNLSSGTRLGRYEIRALLGSGGMGEVYLAYDRDLEREIAIKVLRDGSGDSGDRLRRFEQEAKAASALHHPNIAHVYEIGSQDNLRFIAMELVQGETLRDRLARGPMPIADVFDIGTQIAAAISAAHKSGVIHRDIKPENVIIMSEGYAKVLDFGLAKLREIRGDDAATLLKTRPGVAMGTISYMAPEQLVGGDVTPAAHRDDGRHNRVHAARTDHGTRRGRAVRRLGARRRVVRNAHGAPAVRRGNKHRNRLCDSHESASAAA